MYQQCINIETNIYQYLILQYLIMLMNSDDDVDDVEDVDYDDDDDVQAYKELGLLMVLVSVCVLTFSR